MYGSRGYPLGDESLRNMRGKVTIAMHDEKGCLAGVNLFGIAPVDIIEP